MADVFISYKQEERVAIERIATNLRALGLSVWFDASISAGETFNDEIDREARAASAVLVCWSPAARESRWVKAEAMIGFEQNKLVASYVAGPDAFSPPTPFNTSHIQDLRGWLAAASDTDASWKSVLRRIGKLCNRADIESWGALPTHSSADALRVWISAHPSSPLLLVANKLLRERDAEEAERARPEYETRERGAQEEVQRQSEEEAERREQEASERRERAERRAQDQEIDSARKRENAADQTRIPATMIGLFAALAIIVAVVVGTALNAGRVPSNDSPPALTYEGIAIGWSRDEVLARRGLPQLALGIPGSAGEGGQRIYAVDVEAWPFQLRDGESKSDHALPEGTRVVDYLYWVYTAPQNNGHQVQVEFDPTTAEVVAVSCEIQQGFGETCAPYGNVQIGAHEQQVITSLGQPSSASSNGTYRTLRYDQLGARFRLNGGRIYGISIGLPGRVPAGEAPEPTAPADNSVVGRWIGVLVWSDGATEPIALNFRANGRIGNQNDLLLPSSHWVQDGRQVVARYSFFSVRGEVQDGLFCGDVRSTLGAGRTGSVALHRQAQGQLIAESASCPGGQSEDIRDAGARDAEASREASAIPPNCEGLDLLYQRDSIVTEIEANGSVFAYKGRAISGGALYTYIAYRDLGLEVGDSFCGYQANNVMRIAGDRASADAEAQ